MRTLIGGVGYRNLRDHSAAFHVLDRLLSEDLGPNVSVEDISYNPVAVAQWLEAEPVHSQFAQAVVVTAVERDRPGGEVTAYRWDGVLPPDELIHQAITEAVTGIIAMENTIAITAYFKVLPPRVVIMEIEPVDHAFGEAVSPAVNAGIDAACAMIRTLIGSEAALAALPSAPLPPRRLLRAGGL